MTTPPHSPNTIGDSPTEAKKAVLGRPSKYHPKYCQELIDHMAQGYTFESFAGKIDVAEATINNWQNEHEDFLEAHQAGHSKMRLFWEEMGIQGSLEGKNFNASAWKFNVQNKLRWRENHDVTTDGKAIPMLTLDHGVKSNTETEV